MGVGGKIFFCHLFLPNDVLCAKDNFSSQLAKMVLLA